VRQAILLAGPEAPAAARHDHVHERSHEKAGSGYDLRGASFGAFRRRFAGGRRFWSRI